VAVLPAFRHAARNSVLAALVSDVPTKRRLLSRRYKVKASYSYDAYDECLKQVDAVYIALPNAQHRGYAVRAAHAGVHVLCEKPLAVTADDCREMIDACRANGVGLMVAYQLHFEETNLQAIDLVRRGRIGEPKFFNSSSSRRSTGRPRRGSRCRFRPSLRISARPAGSGCRSGASGSRA
jgi:glucose-fructose oxidoreductase